LVDYCREGDYIGVIENVNPLHLCKSRLKPDIAFKGFEKQKIFMALIIQTIRHINPRKTTERQLSSGK
jgi:hypothetical protein